MIRPEAAAALRRWREVLIGGAVVALGVYWGFFIGGGVLSWIGYLVMAGGAALLVAGVQRARFRLGDDGPGVVHVIEGRISYFGPLDGGLVDLEALSGLDLDHAAVPPVWVLRAPGQPPLSIPLTAKGADALFDAFSALPGIRTEHMLRQMQTGGAHTVVIWRSEAQRAAMQRLH